MGALDTKTKFSQAARTSRKELHRGQGQNLHGPGVLCGCTCNAETGRLSDLAKALPFARATVHRILYSLEKLA